jgi:hypothetical protein
VTGRKPGRREGPSSGERIEVHEDRVESPACLPALAEAAGAAWRYPRHRAPRTAPGTDSSRLFARKVGRRDAPGDQAPIHGRRGRSGCAYLGEKGVHLRRPQTAVRRLNPSGSAARAPTADVAWAGLVLMTPLGTAPVSVDWPTTP